MTSSLWVSAEGLEPRPSPCKGERNVQVGGLASENAVPTGAGAYRCVPSSCYASVMRFDLSLSSCCHDMGGTSGVLRFPRVRAGANAIGKAKLSGSPTKSRPIRRRCGCSKPGHRRTTSTCDWKRSPRTSRRCLVKNTGGPPCRSVLADEHCLSFWSGMRLPLTQRVGRAGIGR
jgi:hypothetical protein